MVGGRGGWKFINGMFYAEQVSLLWVGTLFHPFIHTPSSSSLCHLHASLSFVCPCFANWNSIVPGFDIIIAHVGMRNMLERGRGKEDETEICRCTSLVVFVRSLLLQILHGIITYTRADGGGGGWNHQRRSLI